MRIACALFLGLIAAVASCEALQGSISSSRRTLKNHWATSTQAAGSLVSKLTSRHRRSTTGEEVVQLQVDPSAQIQHNNDRAYGR